MTIYGVAHVVRDVKGLPPVAPASKE
jgi:hypothetical protein